MEAKGQDCSLMWPIPVSWLGAGWAQRGGSNLDGLSAQ
jgi:hypothetical protein